MPSDRQRCATLTWKNVLHDVLVHSQLAHPHAPKVAKNPEKFPHPSCVSEKSQRLLWCCQTEIVYLCVVTLRLCRLRSFTNSQLHTDTEYAVTGETFSVQTPTRQAQGRVGVCVPALWVVCRRSPGVRHVTSGLNVLPSRPRVKGTRERPLSERATR